MVNKAELQKYLDIEIKHNSIFAANWGLTKDWSEKLRYNAKIKKSDAENAYIAVSDQNDGILTWVKKYW